MEIKRIFKKFISKGYFEKFDSENLFYITDSKNKGVAIFSDKVLYDSFGIRFYFNQDGLNYLHDIFTSETNYIINPMFSETTMICFSSRSELLPEDIDFLHQMKVNVVKNDNLILYSMHAGYSGHYFSLKEMNMVLDYMYYLMSIIEHEEKDLLEAFKEKKMVVSAIDTKLMQYQIQYTPLFIFEKFSRFHRVQADFVEDIKYNVIKDDTCYLVHTYLPDETNPYFHSILMLYSHKNEDYEYQIIPCKPEDICDYVLAFMEDYIKVHGIPNQIVIDDRKIYSKFYKTFKELSIDVVFRRESKEIGSAIVDLYEHLWTSAEISDGVNGKFIHYIS